MTKQNAKNCWEYMECPDNIKTDCEAYKLKMGDECWYLADIKNGCPSSQKSNNCFDCDWYKVNNNQK